MKFIPILLVFLSITSCKENNSDTNIIPKEVSEETVELSKDTLIYPEEVHFKSIQQVTFGGDNAEAYWSFDDKQLVFQSNFSHQNALV